MTVVWILLLVGPVILGAIGGRGIWRLPLLVCGLISWALYTFGDYRYMQLDPMNEVVEFGDVLGASPLLLLELAGLFALGNALRLIRKPRPASFVRESFK